MQHLGLGEEEEETSSMDHMVQTDRGLGAILRAINIGCGTENGGWSLVGVGK